MRRALLVIVSLAAALGAGCGQKLPTTARVGYPHAMVTLDPHAHNDGVTGTILSAVYEPLVSLVPGEGPVPRLATAWSNPEPTRWRFELRPGVLFHDGRPLTAGDVVASLERVRSGVGLTVASFLDPIRQVRVAPGATPAVEVTTFGPAPMLLERLSMVAIAPQYFDPQRPVGSGPFRWASGRERGPISLERWERYWGEPASLERVEIGFVADEAAQRAAVKAATFDAMAATPQGLMHGRSLPAGWSLVEIPFFGTTLLGLNLQRPPLDDPRVREAVDLALDRQALIREAFPERGATVASTLLPPGVEGQSAEPPGATADPERARHLLSAAGVTTPLALDWQQLGLDPAAEAWLERSLKAVGLEVERGPAAYDTSYRRILEGHAELFAMSWSFRFGNPQDFLVSVVHSRDLERNLGLMNGSGYANPALDTLIERIPTETDPATRLALIRDAMAVVRRDRPYLPLFHHQRFALVREPFHLAPRSGLWLLPQELSAR